jgi:hypothetical protein
MQGPGGMYGYSDSTWRELGGPLDVERLMSEVRVLRKGTVTLSLIFSF